MVLLILVQLYGRTQTVMFGWLIGWLVVSRIVSWIVSRRRRGRF